MLRALPIRIVGGETHFTRYDLRPFFEKPLPDPATRSDARRLHSTSRRFRCSPIPGACKWRRILFHELNVQLLASIPNGAWIEDMGLSADLFIDPVPIENGMITAPERPGHGLTFEPEILKDSEVYAGLY